MTIVGIARDAKYASLDERTPPHIYLPLTQAWQPTQTLLVRTAGDPAPIGLALQQAVQTIDPLLPARASPRWPAQRESSCCRSARRRS